MSRIENFQQHFVKKSPWWKVTMDFTLSFFALILLAPILLITAVLIKVFMPGPILFSQLRSGQGGQPFKIYKFRTMVVNAEQLKKQLMRQNERDGPAFKMQNDPRITKLGAFLRKTSIDEIPQLFNVLKGDMSLVGPRPLPVEEDNNMQQWQVRRRELKPGITGLWQISKREEISFDHWMRLDVYYLKHLSLWLDFKILIKTCLVVFRARGDH